MNRQGVARGVLPPRSPKLNGHVERAQCTHTTVLGTAITLAIFLTNQIDRLDGHLDKLDSRVGQLETDMARIKEKLGIPAIA